MLDDKQKDALRRWYRQPKILDEAREQIQREYWEDLEELLHMRCLIPLGRTPELVGSQSQASPAPSPSVSICAGS